MQLLVWVCVVLGGESFALVLFPIFFVLLLLVTVSVSYLSLVRSSLALFAPFLLSSPLPVGDSHDKSRVSLV